MIIGLVVSSPPGYSETFFRNKIKFLEEVGIKVIVFADKNSGIKADYNLVEGFSRNSSRLLKAKKTIKSIIRLLCSPNRAFALYKLNVQSGYSKKENLLSLLASAHILSFDLDWLHFGFSTIALTRENLATVLGARMAVSIRGYDIAIYPLKHSGCYQLLWQRIDKLHYISDDLYHLAIEQGFDSKTSHQKITPAIDTHLFRKAEISAFGKPLRIMTVARLHWKKGLEYTLEALSLLQEIGIDFEYIIIGEGKDYERLVFASYQLGIKDKVHFVGKKTHQEVKEIYQKSYLYLQYSVQEGFCNAVLEAQAMGLLCIVSDAEGLAENVLDEKTGWVVPKRNPKALAEQIIKVLSLSNPELRRISESAVKRIREKFNLEKQKSEFLEFYK